MGVFCKDSVDRAYKDLKKRGDVRDGSEFWRKLSECANTNGTISSKYSAETFRKYLNGKTKLNLDQIRAVKRLGRALGVTFELIDDNAQSFVMDASLLNLEHNLSLQNRKQNRVEPNIDETGTHSAVLHRGFKSINFGTKESDPDLYTTQLFIDRCQIQIKSHNRVKFREEEPSDTPSPFHYLGRLADKSITQWDGANIPKTSREVSGSLGGFFGSFTEKDSITVVVQKNDFKFGKIENLYNSDKTPEIDITLAKAIQAQREAVLKDALLEACSNTYALVVRPLIDSD